jgi:hypothetical protein
MKGNSEKVHFSSNHDGATLFLLEPCTIYILLQSTTLISVAKNNSSLLLGHASPLWRRKNIRDLSSNLVTDASHSTGHSAFSASLYKNYVESLCIPPNMRSVPPEVTFLEVTNHPGQQTALFSFHSQSFTCC